MTSKQIRATNEHVSSRRKTTTMWVDGRDGKHPLPWSKVLPLGLLGSAAVLALSTVLVVARIESELTAETIADLERAGIQASGVEVDYSYRSGVIRVPRGVTPDAVLDAVAFGGIRDLEVVRSTAGTTDTVAATTTAVPTTVTSTPATSSTATSTTATSTTATSTTATADAVTSSTAAGSAANATSPLPAGAAPASNAEVRAIWVGGKLTLTGIVASEEQRTALVAAATASVGGAAVEDRLIVNGPAPVTDAQTAALASMLAEVPSLTNATFLLIGDNLSVTGDAVTEAAAAVVEGAAEALDQVDGSATIRVSGTPSVALDELRTALAALAPEFAQTVVFSSSSSELNDLATATLDKVVAVLEVHAAPVVTIVGHTDARGGRAANQRLSEARSAAVLDYLVRHGIDPARLQSRGSGETAPIAANSTEDGRSRNRRVELVAADGF